jgi:two-component system, OmpR family, sensor histidine kinase KdpD
LNLRFLRVLLLLAVLTVLTFIAHVFPVNALTAGYVYLLFVLVVASIWGFVEASILSIAATLVINFFFLPPLGTFNIAETQNWVALFTFLSTSLIASRLSTKAKQQALDAMERQKHIERLYSFSRAILLIDNSEAFPELMIQKLADIFQFDFVVLYDRRTQAFSRSGLSDIKELEEQLRDTAINGKKGSNGHSCTFTPVRLGSDPIASLAVQCANITDSVLQGIANLVAIGLERARAQELAHEIEMTRRSEQLRSTLIDAMAHEFKTPLTSIRATTTLLLDKPDQSRENWIELLRIADEEAQHLGSLIEDTVEMARLDAGYIKINSEELDICEIIQEVLGALKMELQGRPLEIVSESKINRGVFDRHLIKLVLKQLIDNALKYSPLGTPLRIRVRKGNDMLTVEITDFGNGIPANEQGHIFERFYRSPDIKNQIPGSGLGLSIAQNIARVHGGELKVSSCPGETTFQLILPLEYKGGHLECRPNSSN